MPPMPITAIDTAAETRRTCSSATAFTAGPDNPPLPAPSQGSGRTRRKGRCAKSVDEGDRVGAPLFRRDRNRRGVRGIRRQLHHDGLLGPLAKRGYERVSLRRLLADDESGLHVGTRDVQLQRGDLVAPSDPVDEPLEAGAVRRHDGNDEGHRQLGELRQVVGENPSSPLFGSPIELIIPLDVS